MGAPRGNPNGPKTKGNKDASKEIGMKYIPSPKHAIGGWGTPNPIKTKKEGQKLLNTGIKDGKQIYNVTADGRIVKFQPDNTPQNGYHSYAVNNIRDIKPPAAKKMYEAGMIDYKTYIKIIRNKLEGE